MKETNLRAQKHRLSCLTAERKLNNPVYNILVKAGLVACLFLLPGGLAAQDFAAVLEHERRAYALALNLQTTEAHALIPNPKTVSEHYVVALAEALELLVTEDPREVRRI